MEKKAVAPLRIIPLGGLGEIGLNMSLIQYGDHFIIVDCGLMFPEDSMLGVDIVIPDFSFLEERKDKLLALMITHGHEDHVGAVPYLLKKFKVPIYATKLTLALLEPKLSEHKITDYVSHVIHPDRNITIGDFNFEFARVSHSIMDGIALGIRTPAGMVVHSGDFKLDFAPAGDHTTDIRALAKFGDQGVLCLMSDSTNVEQYGYTLTEQEVGAALEDVFRDATGRIILTLFASNVARIQQVFNIAETYGRKVCLSGKSMLQTVAIARKLGYLQISEAQLFDLKSLSRQSKHRTVILTTGSQGEPLSALSRIASGSHKQIQVEQGDTVILSSKIIPGNEGTISALINELYRKGAQVVYETISLIHTSGHAHKEELKLMIKLIRPTHFIPIHGEMRHLIQHLNLARDMGVKPENLIQAKNGDIVTFENGVGKITGKVKTGRVFVDGKGVGDVGNIIITDRRLLSESGVVICVISYKEKTGEIVDGPKLQSRGFVYEPDFQHLIDEVKEQAVLTFKKLYSENLLEENSSRDIMSRDLRRLFNKRIQRRPVVIPVFIKA